MDEDRKTAFRKIQSITESKIYHIVNQVKFDLPTAHTSLRVKHYNRPNKIPEEQHEDIRHHIQYFPAEQSHYSRTQNPNRKYLNCTLSIPAMYETYVEQLKIQNRQPGKSQCTIVYSVPNLI